jgi:DNA-binding MarR family transcriptional regulator
MTEPKQAIPPSRAAELRGAIELFYFAYRAFTAEPDRILAQKGLGRVHHRVLYFVGHNPDISVSGLLAVLAVSKQALNAPLRQLIEMGLIEDRPSIEDKRVKCLRLSRAGELLETKLTETQMRLLDRHFTAVGHDHAQGWLRAMHALASRTVSGENDG